MNIRTLVMVLALAISGVAIADITNVEEGIESSTSDLRLPDNGNGYLLVSSCANCEELTLRLSMNTSFLVNGKSVEYEDFRLMSQEKGNGLDIYYEPKSKSVTRMMLRGHFDDD